MLEGKYNIRGVISLVFIMFFTFSFHYHHIHFSVELLKSRFFPILQYYSIHKPREDCKAQ